MEADGGIGVRVSGNVSGAVPPWAARIRRATGEIAGSGILLSPDRVLTCAHVVSRSEQVTVEFVGAGRDVPSVPARVLEDAYVPETKDADGDPSGDVALLALERPRPAGDATSLYRLSAPGREVLMYGFPLQYNGGIRFRATTVGLCGRDGQVQLAPHTPGEVARPGFSGGGVVDAQTGQVVGMVLSGIRDSEGGRFSFASPAETIVQHLPQVAAWTRGPTAVDERLRSADDGTPPPLDEPFAQRLARWLQDDGRQVKISLVPAGDRVRSATLRRAITLADRESRTPESISRASLDPPETVPAVGGHDLAVDAAGLTAASVAERVAERMGLPRQTGEGVTERIRAAPVTLTLVVVGVDEAADPPALLDLLAVLCEQGSRLLLVFRGPGPHHDRAQRELVIRPAQERLARLLARLDEITGPLAATFHRLTGLVTPGTARTDTARTDTARIVSALVKAHAAREELRGARGLVAGLGQSPELADHERAAERRHARLTRAVAELDGLLRRRDELRGRLTAYHALSHGTEEDGLETAALYRDAHRLLHTRPCDVPVAEAAVGRYITAVESGGRVARPER